MVRSNRDEKFVPTNILHVFHMVWLLFLFGNLKHFLQRQIHILTFSIRYQTILICYRCYHRWLLFNKANVNLLAALFTTMMVIWDYASVRSVLNCTLTFLETHHYEFHTTWITIKHYFMCHEYICFGIAKFMGN